MTAKRNKYVECWGADKPFANINETALATNIGLAVRTSGRDAAPIPVPPPLPPRPAPALVRMESWSAWRAGPNAERGD